MVKGKFDSLASLLTKKRVTLYFMTRKEKNNNQGKPYE